MALARRDLDERQHAKGPVRDPDAWLATARQRRLERDGSRLTELHHRDPAADGDQLAGLLAAEQAPAASTSQEPTSAYQATARANQERNMAALYAARDQPPPDPAAAARGLAAAKAAVLAGTGVAAAIEAVGSAPREAKP